MYTLRWQSFVSPNKVFGFLWIKKFINRFIVTGNSDFIENQFLLLFKKLKTVCRLPLMFIYYCLFKLTSIFGWKWVRAKATNKKKQRKKSYVKIAALAKRKKKISLGLGWFRRGVLNNNLSIKNGLLFQKIFNGIIEMCGNKKKNYMLAEKRHFYDQLITNRILMHFRW